MRSAGMFARLADFALLLGTWSLACAAFCFALNLDSFAVFAFCVVTFCALVIGLLIAVFRRPAFKAEAAHSRQSATTFSDILERTSDDGVSKRRFPVRAYRLLNRRARLLQVRSFGASTAILAAVMCAILAAAVLPHNGNRFVPLFEIAALGVVVFGATTLWFAFVAIASQKQRLRWLSYLVRCWRAQL